MIDSLREVIWIPPDDVEATAYLVSLVARHPGIAEHASGLRASTGSAQAVLRALVDDGIFDRMTEADGRNYEEEVRRHEGQQRTLG